MSSAHVVRLGAALVFLAVYRVPRATAQLTQPAAAPPAIGRDTVVERMVEATVQIRCSTQDGGTIPMGSGVVVGDAKTVITNQHVIEGCKADEPGSRVKVQAYDGSMATGTVIRTFPGVDVAVVQIAGSLPVVIAPIRSDASARVMEQVVAMGYPGLAQFAGVSGQQARATIGVVSRLAAQDLASDGSRWVLEHGAPIYPGNSGGPLFDQCGAVLGINTFVPVDRQTHAAVATIAYAVGSRTIVKAASEVLNVPLGLGSGGCGQALGGGTKQALVAENARAVTDSTLKAFYARTVATTQRWEREFQDKSAARDSAIGDALSMVGEQAGNAQRSSEDATRRIGAIEARWAQTEVEWRNELRRQRLAIAVVALIALVGVTGAALALARAGRARGLATSAGDRADEAMRLAKQAIAAAERAAERRLDTRGRGEVSRIWSALDERPGYSAMHMSKRERTRIVDGSIVPLTGPAITIQVEDARGRHSIQLPPGTTAYIGRDAETMEIVAQRYLVPRVIVPIEERPGDNIVSRCHCSIAHRDDHLEVVDLSSNGTFVEATGARLSFGQAQAIPQAVSLTLARRESPYRIVAEGRAVPAYSAN